MSAEINILQVSKEEMEMVLRAREENARVAELIGLRETLHSTLNRINQLGGRVELPSIGGKYVSYHTPRVTANEVKVVYKYREL